MAKNIHADDGDDAVFAGANDDYENGGKGNDELYAQDGDDVLEGGLLRLWPGELFIILF